MSFSTLTKNLYPGLTTIVGWMLRFLRVTSTPSWPTCWPTACPTCCPTLGDCSTEEFVPWLSSIPAEKSDVSSAPERILPQ